MADYTYQYVDVSPNFFTLCLVGHADVLSLRMQE